MHKRGFYERFLKRPIDLLVSLLALIILSPLLLIISILVKLKLGSPIIFKQQRPGLNEKIFNLYKFRTMTNQKDDNGNLLSDDIRLTKFGKFLRASSLDELPGLLNIILGDLSLVGPRPQLVKDLVFMSDIYRKRHLIRPGLTGLAQVNGRNNISWDNKLSLDLIYMTRISFIKDICILFKTIIKVLKKSDVATNGMSTAEDYGDYLLRIGNITYEYYLLKVDESNSLIDKTGGYKK
jgi:lipopolysaccharide/colanic/teichoic acid biosynthesis glycosyltransferase